MSPYVVALTGGIGSGKSSVGDLFAERGATIVDSDAISHRLTGPDGAALPELQAAFGKEIVQPSAGLDRPKMRALVFQDAAARHRLESILHPLITEEARRLTDSANGPYVIRMIPLLVEGGEPHRRFSRVLVVDCDQETQIARVMSRSNMSRAEVEAIIGAQASRAMRLAHADDIIDNNGPPTALVPQVDRLHGMYLQLAGER